MNKNSSESKIDLIFFAVRDLIHEGGLAAVTLSAVCRRAGVSKGGLMHHYSTKDALVKAFIERSSDECLTSVHERLASLPRGNGKRVKAYVDLMLKDPAMCSPTESRDAASVMIALMQGHSASAAEDYYARLSKELKGDGISPALLELIIATVDGLWLQSAVLSREAVIKKAAKIRTQLVRMLDAEISDRLKKHPHKRATKQKLVAGDAS